MEKFIQVLKENIKSYGLEDVIKVRSAYSLRNGEYLGYIWCNVYYDDGETDIESMSQIVGACTDFMGKYEIDFTLVKMLFLEISEEDKMKMTIKYPCSAIKEL